MSSIYGNTPQGQGVQQMLDILNSIQGVAKAPIAPATLQAGQNAFQSAAMGMQANAGPAMQQATDTLTQQAGIPQLNAQYGDLAKMFQLYLADGNLASKYFNSANTNPYADPTLMSSNTGTPPIGLQTIGQSEVNTAPQSSGIANPYLGSPSAIAAMASPAPASGIPGGGFTTPGAAMTVGAQPVASATNLMDLIKQLTSTEQGIVNQKSGDASTNYQAAMKTLSDWASAFGGAYDKATTGAGGTLALNNSMAQDAQTGMTLDAMMKKYGTQTSHDDILKLYNTYSKWGSAKKTRDQLSNKYGITKAYLDELGLPTAADVKKQKDNFNVATAAIKGFGDLANEYQSGSQEILPQSVLGGVRVLNPLSKSGGSVEAMKKVYTGKLQQALKIGRGKYNYEQLMKSIPGPLASSAQAEGNLRGHLSELLTNNDLLIVKENSTGKKGLTDINNFDPSTETEIDVMNEPWANVLAILKGL